MSESTREEHPDRYNRSDFVRVAAIGLAYLLAHQLAFLLQDSQKVLAAVWPAGGVGLAALLLTRRRLWPAILAAFFVSGILSSWWLGRPLPASAGLMAANVAESLACAWLIVVWCGPDVRFVRVREVLALAVVATVVNAGTAVLGAGTAALSSKVAFGSLWRTWWVADGLGILLVTPLIVSWRNLREGLSEWRWHGVVEGLLFLVVWSGVGRLSFDAAANVWSPHPYMLVALLAWPGLRFGQRGVTLALVALAAIVLTSRAAGGGAVPWGIGDSGERLLSLQIFLAFLGFTAMLLAAAYTEARNAAQASREDQARVRAVGDNLPNGMVYQIVRELDGSRRFLHVSAGIERLQGLTAAEVLHDSSLLYQTIVDEDRPMLAAAEEVSAKDVITFSLVVRLRRRDGEIRWMQFSSSPRRLPDGRILWDGIQTDVTESRRREQALRESEERYRVLVHNTEMPVVVVGVAGSRILFANEPTAEFFGCPASQLAGMSMADFWRNAGERERIVRLLLETGRLAGVEAQFVARGGEEKWAKVGSTLIDYGGERAILSVFSDITGLKALQQRLEGERAFLKTLIHNIPDMVWLKNPEGVFLGCNSAFETFLQAKECDIVGKTDFDFFPPPDAERYQMGDREAIAAGGPKVTHEPVTMRADGRPVLLEAIKSPMRDGAGRLIGVMGIARDISLARQAEALLRERVALQEQLETTAAVLPGAIHSYRLLPDGASYLLYASPVFEDIWGVAPEVVTRDASRLWSAIHPDDIARVKASLAESARSMTEWRQEFRVRHPQKGEIWVEGRSTPVRDGEGVVCHGFETDITARKRAEMALAEAAIRRRILVEESKDGIAVLDLSGNLREWNRSFAEMLGYDSREVGGMSVWDWNDQWCREELLEALRDRASAPATFETWHRRKDGTRFEVEVSASGAEFGGEVLVFCVHRDIAGRRQAEKERDLLQQELLEARRLESIEVLAGGMAHEFNNLLTVINGYAALLRSRFVSDNSALADVSEIQRAGQRAADLTQQLLAYGRQRMIRPKSLNLNSIVEDGHGLWRGLLGQNILVITEPCASLSPTAADPEQIAEVILHLVRNASDAMPDGGVLTLRTGNVEISEDSAGRYRGGRRGRFVMLVVTDNGIGMDEKTAERIFDPFFTTKERALASGLGLATVQGIVAQHEGWIAVESAPGMGSSFSVYLPSADSADPLEMPGLEAAGGAGELATILVVEDQEAVRGLALSVLRTEGYRTIEAAKGRDAIALAARHPDPIDLLVTDVIMPGMNGPELAAHLKARIPSIKVLYFSGYPEEVIANHGVHVVDAAFIPKPYPPDALIAKVREILAS